MGGEQSLTSGLGFLGAGPSGTSLAGISAPILHTRKDEPTAQGLTSLRGDQDLAPGAPLCKASGPLLCPNTLLAKGPCPQWVAIVCLLLGAGGQEPVPRGPGEPCVVP